jgi:hypothetical protein
MIRVLLEWQARQCSRRYNTRIRRLSDEASALPAARGAENKSSGVRVTPIIVVALVDPKLLINLIDMKNIDADSVGDCTDESVMEFLESTQERDASVTAEFVKAEVLTKVTFAMSENDPALRVKKTVADYYLLHRNLRLDFINGKPKKAVENLVSVIRPATLGL